jgi:hypothetical protein
MVDAFHSRVSRARRFWDILGLVGWLFALPAALLVCGQSRASSLIQSGFGPFGAPSSLLLAFIATALLRMLFGSVGRAIPVLVGTILGLGCFAAVFDFPGLSFIRAVAARFPAFAQPGPAFFAGLFAIAAGSLLGLSDRGRSLRRSALLILATLACLVCLAWLQPFPKIDSRALSVDAALAGISKTLGYKYHNPEVERAVRKVVEEKNKTVAEKETMIAELTARLQKSEEDRASLKKSAEDAARLGGELDEAKKALNDLKGKIDGDTPLVQGGDYAKAIQPSNPAVRDFAVKIAESSPGAFDDPQGSKLPSEAGLRQALLVHGSISSSWKYVSDPSVDWALYVSPARRTLAVGLAGNCADFAVFVASCIEAIGGRARIVHGFTRSAGHAWAELWLGEGARSRAALLAISGMAGRPPGSIAVDQDDSGGRWLVLDWRLGEYTLHGDRIVVAWTGGR